MAEPQKGRGVPTPALIIFVYAALVIVGGVLGFVQAGSQESLIASVVSGGTLLLAGWAMSRGKIWGLPIALIMVGVLFAFFSMRFFGTHKIMPSGMMMAISFVTLTLLLLTSRGR